MTCGGCCGRGTHRKLDNFAKQIKKREGVDKDKIVVHLSSCITKESYHGSTCPHLSYLKGVIGKLSLDVIQDTTISEKAEERRKKDVYRA
jgi:predicted metal-binding protein